MIYKEKIYNYDNLSEKDMDEKTTRARGIIINDKNEVLMCYSNGTNHYEFPGGHLKENETLEDGLKREILEETGIEIGKKSATLFYKIKYYCKNYHNSEKNRIVEIYYYIIDCNSTYNESKRNLDLYEKEHNYECRYVNVFKLKEVLEENKKSTKEFNTALDDMLLVWNEYLKRYD